MKTPTKVSAKVFFLVLIFAILQCGFVNAQLSFQKIYGIKSLTETLSQADGNGGVVTAGVTFGPQNNNNGKISLTRFDKTGKVVWSKFYHNQGNTLRPVSFLLAENGDYMLAGYKSPVNESSKNEIFLLRVNIKGEIVWSRNYFKDYSTVFYSLGRTYDNGYFLYANQNDGPSGLPYNIVIKVDKNGKLQWTNKYIDTWKWGKATSTSDGGFVISNISKIYKIDKDGKVVWAKEFTEIGFHNIGKVTELGDNGILFIVWRSATNKEGFIFKLNKNGNLVWTSGFKDNFYNYFDPILQPSGGFLLTASGFLNAFPGQYRGLILQMNEEGKILKVLYPKSFTYNLQLISSGNNLFIGGTDNSLYSLAKINAIIPNGCFDTSSVASGTPPEISSSDINVPQSEISFQEKELPLVVENLEVQEDTLCFECKKPMINLGNDTTLCAGEKLALGAEINDVNYEWSTGEKTSSINVEKAGTYWLKITNECGSVTDTITINYNKEPEFRMKVSSKIANPWDKVYFSDSTVGIKNRYWDFGDSSFSTAANAEHTYGKNGNFTVKLLLEDSSGCKYVLSENIKVRFESLYLPNAFSPDGNGFNDTFSCIGYGIKHYRLKIYNRWGELIFDKENEGWDGKFKNFRCPAGLYLYMLEAVFENRIEHRNGYFYLER